MKVQSRWMGALMVSVFVTWFALGTAYAQDYPNLGDWANTWFKVKLTRTVFHYSDVGVKPTPSYQLPQSMGTAYINLTNWDGINHILTADIYARNHETGEWDPTPFFKDLEITYFAGSDLKFIGSAQLVIPNDVTMGLIFVFTGKKNVAGNFILGGITKLGTIASSMLEIDDVPGSTERWTGSVKISGPMVPADSLPFTPTP